MTSPSEIREVAAEALGYADSAPAGEGGRATAVARWGEIMRARTNALERLADVVDSVAPGALICTTGTNHVLEHAKWLARHDELFDGADDHRDALVVVSAKPLAVPGEGGQLGWGLQLAFEAGTPPHRHVFVARGPFVTGVCRVMRPVDELYPGADEGTSNAAAITLLPPEPPWRERVEAAVGDVTVQLFGRKDVETIARLLAVARSGAR